MLLVETNGLLVAWLAAAGIAGASIAGRLVRGAKATWAPALGPAWKALAFAALSVPQGLAETVLGSQALAHVWIALGLCMLVHPRSVPGAQPRSPSTWALVVPLPAAVLTLGTWMPSQRPSLAPDALVPGFAGGLIGPVPLSGVLLAAQVVSLAAAVGFRGRLGWTARGTALPELHTLGGGLGRILGVAWVGLALWPEYLPLYGVLACTAVVLGEARPKRAAQEHSLSSITRRAFLKANQRMGAELLGIEAEILQGETGYSALGSEQRTSLLRRLRGAHALASRLSQVSRDDAGPRTLDSLAAIVDRAARRVENPSQLELHVRSRGSAEAGVVDADGVELALAALLQNAVDAQDAVASRLPIEVEIDTQTPIPAEAEHLREAVLVRIFDSGEGLRDEDRWVCFEPFYTTRENHDGLGLSVVGALARVGDAVVELVPRRGQPGTVASLWLRWTGPTSSSALQWAQSQLAPDGADVLVVAASARRRELLSLMLAERGVRAATTADWRSVVEGDVQAPRPWGLVVFPDAADHHDLPALVRWLSRVYAFVVAPPDLASQLVAKGLPEGRLQRAVSEQVEAMVQMVLASLEATQTGAVVVEPSRTRSDG